MLVKECYLAVTRGKRRVEENAEEAASVKRETVVHAAGFYICIHDRLLCGSICQAHCRETPASSLRRVSGLHEWNEVFSLA